jgi:hypothetical protein
MTLTPEKIREIEAETAKFLRHLTKEEREKCDVINVKNLLSAHPREPWLSLRAPAAFSLLNPV